MTDVSILIVDDSKTITLALEKMLMAKSYDQIRSAYDGQEALDKIKESIPDVIFIDLQMPVMDGLELISHLNTTAPDVEIIIMSGYDQNIMNAAAEVARKNHIHILGLLQKPFEKSNVELLLRRAGKRAKKAKKDSKNQITHEEIRTLIKSSGIVVYYQPKVRMYDRKVIGFEALARLRRTESNLSFPNEFLPNLLTQDGLGVELTSSVLDISFRDLSGWEKDGLDVTLSVNINAEDIANLDLTDRVMKKANQQGCSIDKIVLEFTEKKIFSDVNASLGTLARLRLKKIGVSVDDFGTGSSTLQHLKHIPCSELKVDKSFVTSSRNDNRAFAILKSCVSFGKSLGLQVVAEGVETEQDWDKAAEAKCDIAQGYYISPPMQEGNLRQWLKTWNEEKNLG